MKKPKENMEISYENFAQVLQGHAAFQLLWSGIEFKIYDLLSENPDQYTLEELGEFLSFEDTPTKIVVNGLLTLGLLTRTEATGKLSNSQIAEKYLVRKNPGNLVGMAEWQRYIVYPAAIDFCEAVKLNTNVGLQHFPGDGDTLYKRLATDPFLEKVFQDAMQSISETANDALVQHLDLTNKKHMVDFGGGNGTNAIRFNKKNNQLNVTILDIPSVCEKANANIAKQSKGNKVKTLPGDFFGTPLPKDIDCVLYSHIVTIWSPEKNVELFKKVYDSLPDGGQIFVFSTMGNDDGVGPMLTSLGSVYFQSIATGEGMLYSKQEVSDFLKKAGFSTDLHENLPFDHSLVVGTK